MKRIALLKFGIRINFHNLPILKRIGAILLLLIFLFNWFGYRIVSDFLEQKFNARLEEKFDNNNYDESQLVEIKVPINLPYQTTWTSFERYDGEIELNGIHYKYVKRRVHNDSLVLLCLPNEKKMELQTTRDDFFRLINDLSPAQGKKSDTPNSLSFKNFTTEYYKEKNDWMIAVLSEQHVFHNTKNCFHSLAGFATTAEQPPEI